MTKHQETDNNQSSNSNNQESFGDWVIGIYLELAYLPVGREFGYWKFHLSVLAASFAK
jgi:hypothetical protein